MTPGLATALRELAADIHDVRARARARLVSGGEGAAGAAYGSVDWAAERAASELEIWARYVERMERDEEKEAVEGRLQP